MTVEHPLHAPVIFSLYNHDYSHLLNNLHHLQFTLTAVWMGFSELFTAAAMLWCLNALARAIRIGRRWSLDRPHHQALHHPRLLGVLITSPC